jgi:hypothetical protein
MCPVCLTTVVLIDGRVILTSGLTAIAIKRSGAKNVVDNSPAPPSKDVNEHDRETANCVAR